MRWQAGSANYSEPVDPRLGANRDNWNERVAIHSQSRFYDVEGWLRNTPRPPSREVDAVGDVSGKTLLHLQCHFGMDTLSWARVGATVTGLDFSPAAIEEATALAARAGLSDRATFVCADVYDAPRTLSGQRFDVVYVSLGALGWLPDVAAWGAVVADLLAPGGIFYLHDTHPLSLSLDESGERMIYGYFEEQDNPFVYDSARTYTDGGDVTSTRTYEWNHSLGEVLGALTSRGLVVDSLTEHDWALSKQFPWLSEEGDGRYVQPSDRPRIPLSFTVVAHAPS
jgi:SAM-dependent methyltransferase